MWFRVDDKFPDHPKVSRLSGNAVALWLFAGCYCGEYETDGRIPKDVAYRLAGRLDPQGNLEFGTEPVLIRLLVDSGLWRRAEECYEMHDFLKYNPSKSRLNRKRRQVRQWRKKASRTRVVALGSEPETNRNSTAIPTRPDPTRIETEKESLTVKDLTDRYRALPGVKATPKDGGVIAGQVGKYGAPLVAQVLQRAGASIGAAVYPLQYFVKACAGEAGRSTPNGETAARVSPVRPALLEEQGPPKPIPEEFRRELEALAQRKGMPS